MILFAILYNFQSLKPHKTFLLFGPQIYPESIIKISPKTNQCISPAKVIKLLNLISIPCGSRIQLAELTLKVARERNQKHLCSKFCHRSLNAVGMLLTRKCDGWTDEGHSNSSREAYFRLWQQLKRIHSVILSLSQYLYTKTQFLGTETQTLYWNYTKLSSNILFASNHK